MNQTGFTLRWPGIESRSVLVWFVVDKVALWPCSTFIIIYHTGLVQHTNQWPKKQKKQWSSMKQVASSDTEDGNVMSFRNDGWFKTNYTTLYFRKFISSRGFILGASILQRFLFCIIFQWKWLVQGLFWHPSTSCQVSEKTQFLRINSSSARMLRRVSSLNIFTRLMLILTLFSWVPLEKPPVAQILKNSTTFYGTLMFITAFTWALHWSLFWTRLS
jgi:hypothetical protein